uniref:Nucleosome assembly protein 1-like 1 n=1 Tax=Petromyzon marinus TaxID=7757 RepID=S4R7G4_PETMA
SRISILHQTGSVPRTIEDVTRLPSDSRGWEWNSAKLKQLTAQMMKNPQVLAALQERLDGLSGTPSGYIESLPKVVKRRVTALKNLQVKCALIEAKFYEEVHDLERKYAALYQPLFDRRRDIVTALVEPDDAECEWPNDKEEDLVDEVKEKAKLEEEKKEKEEDPKGIPEFWLTVFKNVDMLGDLVQEYDEPILRYLKDVRVQFSEAGQPMNYTLKVVYSCNLLCLQPMLTSVYELSSHNPTPPPTTCVVYGGPHQSMGLVECKIDWKKGKNITVKTIKKKQKHKGRGTIRTVTKTVANESFFNFFSPPEVPEDSDGPEDEEAETQLATDFEIGHFFRERIVPRAVLYFTGEAIEDEDDYDEEGEDGEEGEEEGDEEDDDPDYEPSADSKQPAECKQQ